MKIGAIIQARTSSTRLPRKVLKPLPFNSNITVLSQVIRRVKQSKLIDEVIVATTPKDDEIVDVAIAEEVPYYQGSLENVLERYYEAACKNDLDVIVRLTSDNPCVDFKLVDNVIKSHLKLDVDYSSTSLIKSFPIGIGLEVINFDTLKKAYDEATEKFEKEHVTPFIYKSHPEEFKINKFKGDNDNSDIRITLDTPQDYALLCAVYDYLYEENNYFLLEDILELFSKKPWLKDINSEIIQKKVFNNLKEELDEVINLCDRQDLYKAKEFLEEKIEDYNE